MTDGGKNTLNRASNSYRILLYCYYAGKNTFTNNFYNSPSKKKSSFKLLPNYLQHVRSLPAIRAYNLVKVEPCQTIYSKRETTYKLIRYT